VSFVQKFTLRSTRFFILEKLSSHAESVIDSEFPEAQSLVRPLFNWRNYSTPLSVILGQSDMLSFLRWRRVLPNSIRVSSLQQVLETSSSTILGAKKPSLFICSFCNQFKFDKFNDCNPSSKASLKDSSVNTVLGYLVKCLTSSSN